MFTPKNKLELMKHNQSLRELTEALTGEMFDDAIRIINEKPYLVDERITISRGRHAHIKNEPIACVAAQDFCKSKDFFRHYVNLGGALEGRTKSGYTPLALALRDLDKESTEENFENIRFLLNSGAKPSGLRIYDAHDNVLADIIDNIPPDIFKRLIDGGCPIEGVTKSGKPWISEFCSEGMNAKKWFKSNFEYILEKSANLNPQVTHIANHPVATVLVAGRIDLAEQMVKKGAKLDCVDAGGRTLTFLQLSSNCLSWVINQHPELVEKPDHQGTSPLLNATQRMMEASQQSSMPKQWVDCIKLLISKNANIDATDDQGPRLSDTPRKHLERTSNEELKEFFRIFKTGKAAMDIMDELFGSESSRHLKVN